MRTEKSKLNFAIKKPLVFPGGDYCNCISGATPNYNDLNG